MRKALLLSLILALPAGSTAREAPKLQEAPPSNVNQSTAVVPALTNSDISSMLKAGLGPEIIVAKIKTSSCNFDTSPAALQELKTAGVPEDVILAMVQAPVAATKPPAGIVPNSSPGKLSETVEVKVPDGTLFEIETRATVSSEEIEEGSVVDFAVVQPVQVNGIVVIERGASARARVIEAKKAGHWGRAGKISWTMQDVVAVDGSRIPSRFTKEAEGGGSSGKVAGAVVATAIVFWPAAPLWGLKKGKPAILPAGKRFNVFVHGDTIVKARSGSQG